MKTLRGLRAGVLATLLCCCVATWARMGPPQVDGFDVEEVNALGTGTSLHFTLYGTPGGSANLRIDGAARSLALAETQSGVYEGRYTIGDDDRIAPDSRVDAQLRVNGEVASASLEEPLVLGAALPPMVAPDTPEPVPMPAEPAAPVRIAAAPVPPAPAPIVEERCNDCGVVQSISTTEQPGRPGYAGAVTGGVIGAIIGNRVGDRDDRWWTRILGALGGALAGREIERANARRTHYEVWVRMDSGERRSLHFDAPPPVKVGERVRLAQGSVRHEVVPTQR